MTFDWTLNIGNIVSLGILAAAVYGIRSTQHKDNIARLEKIETQLDEMRKPWALLWAWFKKEHGITDKD